MPMPQSRRRSGQKKSADSVPPTTLPANLLIRAFRIVGGLPQEISFLNGAGGGAILSIGSLDADGEWKRFDRLVIATGTPTPLVLDVIPDDDAVISFETNS